MQITTGWLTAAASLTKSQSLFVMLPLFISQDSPRSPALAAVPLLIAAWLALRQRVLSGHLFTGIEQAEHVLMVES